LEKKLGSLPAVLAACATLLAASPPASAGEGPFAWIYTLDLQPQGTWQFEQWEWLQTGQSQGDYYFLTNKSEFEYGFRPWYQVGLYLNTEYTYANRNGVDGTTGGPGTNIDPNSDPFAPYSSFRFKSVSMEHIVRFLNPYTDPIGFGLYFEPAIGPYGYELELKVLLQKNFFDDRLVLAANIVMETEQEWQSGATEYDSVLDLLVGASYRFADNWAFGVEFRNHREFSGQAFNAPEHSAYFLGPTIHYANERWWATFGWRHQMPWVQAFNDDQQSVVVNGQIFGDEHAADEFMLRVGIPFGGSGRKMYRE
jgi:opacity protein-like surface antigen